MATLLLKKSYHINLTNETEFRDLWDDHGVFTTMRLVGNPLKIIFFKEHIKNLINSTKKYKIYKKNLKTKLHKILKLNLKNNTNYNHLLRLAINKNYISISVRKRIKPNKNFKLILFHHKRIQPTYKNLKYKKILNKMKNLNTKNYDLALINNKKIYETGTCNLLFIKNDKIYSPNKDFYRGITLKFINKKFNIEYKEIKLKNLKFYDEILLVGSGKGVVAISKIEGNSWNRKSLKYFKILNNHYEKAVTKCPRYYS